MSIQDENMGYDRVNWVPYYLFFMLDKTLDLMHAKFFTHTHKSFLLDQLFSIHLCLSYENEKIDMLLCNYT